MAGTACGSGWDSDCGSGGPRPGRVGRPSPGLGGEPACRAPDSEPESGPRRAGDAEGAGDAGDARDARDAMDPGRGLSSPAVPA